MSSTQWRDESIRGAVIGAMFLRGLDSEVMDVITTLPESAFNFHQYRDIYLAITIQARGKGVIDPILIGEQLPEHQAIIDQTGRIAWARSSLKSYSQQLIRNAALRDAFHTLSDALSSLSAAPSSESGIRILEQVKASVSAIQTESDAIRPVALDELLPVIINRIQRSHGV